MKTRTTTLALLFCLAACGSGGGDGGQVISDEVAIQTQSLDQGNVGFTYFQEVTASGATGEYSWWVSTSGDDLPAGISLTGDGELTGIPTEAAVRTVVVVVQDSNSTLDLRSFRIEVRDIELTASAQGAVVPGGSVTFTPSGGTAGYSFSLTANQSGATISNTGQYTAGDDSGIDVVRVQDAEGFFDEQAVTVGEDPFAGFQPIWNTSDVWWVDWAVQYDPEPAARFDTDFDDVLEYLGLRDPASTGSGTEADQLARLLVIRRTLGWLSSYYGNSMDGNPLQGGLSLSLVGPAGTTTGSTPPAGGSFGAGPLRYSTICVRHGSNSGILGTAYVDFGNDSVEHNCGSSGQSNLGVFANQVAPIYRSVYRNTLENNPVGAGDVDSLRRLLFGNSPQGSRETALFNLADGYGKTLAAVLAHEIGHSLGLNHSDPSGGNWDIMNAGLTVGRSIAYAFNPDHQAELQSSLPGPNR